MAVTPRPGSMTTCEKVPDSMKWASVQPDNTGTREFCTESLKGDGMNDRIIHFAYQKNCQS